MHVIVNGEEKNVADGSTVADALTELGMSDCRGVAVELDGEFLERETRGFSDIHDLTGEPDRAAEAFEQALSVTEDTALRTEIFYRLGTVREKMADPAGALAAYGKAADIRDKSNPYRLSAVARSAGLYEETEDYPKALAAYRDLMDYAEDPELVAAATGRATELEAFINQ